MTIFARADRTRPDEREPGLLAHDGWLVPSCAAPAALPSAFQYADYCTLPVGMTHAEWRRR